MTTPTTHPCVFVDLDGTLCRRNSLKLYMREALLHNLRHGRVLQALGAAALMALRQTRCISHPRMKYGCISLLGTDAAIVERVACAIARNRNAAVEAFLSDRRAEGCRIVLATAAPAFYADSVHGVDDVLASPADGPDLNGERKALAIEQYCRTHTLHASWFLTDHHSDLPAMRLVASRGGDILLVNPSRRTQTAANQDFQRVLPCL